MESITSRVCDKLELIKTDLHQLIQNGSTEKALKTNLFCAIKLYEEIANNLQNELQTFKLGIISNRSSLHYLNLLRWEITFSCPHWIVYEQTSVSLKLLRVREESEKLSIENHVVIQVLPDSTEEMVSLSLRFQSEKLRFKTNSDIFIMYILSLLRAFLPTTVSMTDVNLGCLKEEKPVGENDMPNGVLINDSIDESTQCKNPDIKVEPDENHLNNESSDTYDSSAEIDTNVADKNPITSGGRDTEEVKSKPVAKKSNIRGRKQRRKSYPMIKLLSLPCHLCDKTLTSVCLASKHMNKNHGLTDNLCCVCPHKTFTTKEDLIVHYHVCHSPHKNLDKRTFPCKSCVIPLSRAQSLEHMRIEHGKPHECPFCEFVSNNFDLSNINNLLVDSAMANFDMMERMKQHIQATHPLEDPKFFRCGCKKKFTSRELLREHGNRNIPDNERKTVLCKRIEARFAKVVCGHCGLSFTQNYLAKHAAKEHGINAEEKYKYVCKYCSKRYEWPSLLKVHLLQEHFPDKKEYLCGICKKSFGTPWYLDEHVKRHSTSYKCPKCPKMFKSPSNVRQHLVGCHYPPAFQCLKCGNKYHHRAMIRTHLKSAHETTDDSFILKHKIDIKADLAQIPFLSVTVATE